MYDEDTETAEQNRTRNTYGQAKAHVEDFRIRPMDAPEGGRRMSVLMKFSARDGGGEVYYLTAKVTFIDYSDRGGHRVSIRCEGGDEVASVDTSTVTASPEDAHECVQAIHETYLDAVDDWFEFAQAAAEAGDDDE